MAPLRKHHVELNDWSLSNLNEGDVKRLTQNGSANLLAEHFQRCCLGILGAQKGVHTTEDLPQRYPDFSVKPSKFRQGMRLEITNMPETFLVDGRKLIEAKIHQLVAAVRDVLLFEECHSASYELTSRTDQVRMMLKEADILQPTECNQIGSRHRELARVVTWGGHTVGHEEYTSSKDVGENLGLRFVEIITGSGPGTMKSGLKGNHIGFIQQRVTNSRQYGITALEIVEAEPPNRYANTLSIMPNIEMRLEAFFRLMNAIIIFPGGVGTAEEFLMALAVKMRQENKGQVLPLILTAPPGSQEYMRMLDEFIETVLGKKAKQYYKVVFASPEEVAKEAHTAIYGSKGVKHNRDKNNESMIWNDSLYLPDDVRRIFVPTHENVSKLDLTAAQDPQLLASELRKLFKAIVYGSVVEEGKHLIAKHGKFEIRAAPHIARALDRLLSSFVAQKRIRADHYEPCYVLSEATFTPVVHSRVGTKEAI